LRDKCAGEDRVDLHKRLAALECAVARAGNDDGLEELRARND